MGRQPFWKHHGLSLALLGLMLASLGGELFTGRALLNQERVQHGLLPLGIAAFAQLRLMMKIVAATQTRASIAMHKEALSMPTTPINAPSPGGRTTPPIMESAITAATAWREEGTSSPSQARPVGNNGAMPSPAPM